MFSDAAQFRAQFENAYTCLNDPETVVKAFGDDERAAWLVEGVSRCLWHLQNLMGTVLVSQRHGPSRTNLTSISALLMPGASRMPPAARGRRKPRGMRSVDGSLGRVNISGEYLSKSNNAHLNEPRGGMSSDSTAS